MISGKIELAWQEPVALWWVMVVSIFWSQYSKLIWLSVHHSSALHCSGVMPELTRCKAWQSCSHCCSTISACSTDAGCLVTSGASVTDDSCTHSHSGLAGGLLLTRVQTVLPGLACYHHPAPHWDRGVYYTVCHTVAGPSRELSCNRHFSTTINFDLITRFLFK